MPVSSVVSARLPPSPQARSYECCPLTPNDELQRLELSAGERLCRVGQLEFQHGAHRDRDLREVRTLCLALDYINVGAVEMGMDVLSARIAAIQAAKAKNGSWDKAEKAELIPLSSTSIFLTTPSIQPKCQTSRHRCRDRMLRHIFRD